MSNNNQFEAAFLDLKLQEVFNYFIITKKYGIIHITLIRQFISKTVLNYKVNTKY